MRLCCFAYDIVLFVPSVLVLRHTTAVFSRLWKDRHESQHVSSLMFRYLVVLFKSSMWYQRSTRPLWWRTFTCSCQFSTEPKRIIFVDTSGQTELRHPEGAPSRATTPKMTPSGMCFWKEETFSLHKYGTNSQRMYSGLPQLALLKTDKLRSTEDILFMKSASLSLFCIIRCCDKLRVNVLNQNKSPF